MTLRVVNHGPRTFDGTVRDAWVPSAGASPGVFEVRVDPDHQQDLVTTLTPTRRGDRAVIQVTVRSYGPLRLATGRPPAGFRAIDAAVDPAGVAVVRVATFLPEKLSRLRVIDGQVVTRGRARAPSSTLCAST